MNACPGLLPGQPPGVRGGDALHSDLGLYVNTLPHDLALPLGKLWVGRVSQVRTLTPILL